jgi:hypothetical protein
MSIQIPESVFNQTTPGSSSLSGKISEYSQWREKLIATIDEYIDWSGHSEAINAIQELRLYDIKDVLKKDQLVLAFLAEFSRGKTETINALFFSDFNQRLLPSGPGRTTMCPTEIFWDEREEPCIKLLPIESRQTDDTLTYLKSTPEIWHKFRLDTSSAEAMKQTLRVLVQKREVTLATAKKLGFWNDSDPSMQQQLAEKGLIEIPAWRHALINYPHPLLKNGLVVIDTPGLNTMGAEPELTLSIIPSAQAVVFLTAADTGITKSDMQIWTNYVQKRAAHKLVALNKIDILWDGLESEAEVEQIIQKQTQNTAHELGLDARNIYAISAQKALVAKIRKDDALLKRSRINTLENSLAEQIVRAKHEILGRAVVTECSNMIRASRKLAQIRVNGIKSELAELHELQNIHRDNSKEILAKVVAERKRYEASILTFNQGSEKIKRLSSKLLRHLSIGYLHTTLAQAKQDMGDSWTTVGLNKSIRDITRLATNLAQETIIEGRIIKKHADDLYQLFWSKHGFEKTEAIELDMSRFIQNIQALERVTEEFCASPVNLLTEKHFLIRKFFLGLGVQIQAAFEQMHLDCNHWLNSVIGELKNQINAHKNALDKRVESLMESHNNTDRLLKNIELAEKEYAKHHGQSSQLDTILLKLMRSIKFNPEKPLSPALNTVTTQNKFTATNITATQNNAPFISVNASLAKS